MGSSNSITPGSREPGFLVWKKGETDVVWKMLGKTTVVMNLNWKYRL